MADPIKIVALHRPTITIRSGSEVINGDEWPDGSKEILLDDFVAVRVNYDHRYTDNRSVHDLAERIAAFLAGPSPSHD